MNQRRYRKNQIHKLAGLNEDIRVLREEIDMFHVRRSNRSRTIVIKPTLWGVVGEYFRLFRCGVNPSLSTMSTTRSRQTLQMQYPVEVAHQFSFLQTVMMPRVICGGQRIGVEAHLKEWKTISRTYPDFNMKLVHLGEGPSGDLVATSKAIFTFTEETLCNAFPHLIDNGNKNPIVAKLLGRRLEVDGVTRFTWDETMGRVTKLSFQVDLISPILQVLGSLDLIAIMFNNAFVTPEGHVVVE
ncbi:hypothetical protein PHMEG_00014814 [Phytophthora megakarya]|uniref:Bzip transcription factor n=1 Tax=Phytophthora megakarya TaxID=4795 RepID=A0A225W4X2_9STRA|nr:hypothetical protein PHMEG_00014814 [Phytophthora megakarya]